MTARSTRIVLVDDHVLVRSGMKALLDAQPDLEVTGEAGDGAEGVELALERRPDVVLMDLRMPGIDGIEATRRIVAAGSQARILVVTSHDDDTLVLHALRAGASGFFLKDAAADRLCEAVRPSRRATRCWRRRWHAGWSSRQLGESGARLALKPRFDALTERERDIVRRLARGLSNAALAARDRRSARRRSRRTCHGCCPSSACAAASRPSCSPTRGFVRPGHTGELEL